jgi:two-component system, sensor histidine kinase
MQAPVVIANLGLLCLSVAAISIFGLAGWLLRGRRARAEQSESLRDWERRWRDAERARTVAEQARLQAEQARVHAEQARAHAETVADAAQQAVASKTRLLAAASHDLRQPMHAVGLFVGALEREAIDGRGRYLVERLRRSLAGLDELFNRLLDVSRLDAEVVRPRFAAFEPGPLFLTLENRFQPIAEQRGLKLRVRMPRNLAIRSDPALFTEILMNLLSNALRYTVKGGVALGARKRGDRLLLQVWDTGPGIPSSELQRIFEEFVQLDNAGRDRRKGLGLGLSIVRRLCKSMDCSISARSVPGRGSVFEFSVPLSDEAAPPPASVESEYAPDPVLAGALVMAVDDELDVLAAMEAMLTAWGCYVIVARNIREAQRHLEKSLRFPDLLITDHRLADGTDSAAVVAAVAESVPVPVPVIVVSGDARAGVEQAARSHGWGFLTKPVAPDRLRELIVTTLKAAQP